MLDRGPEISRKMLSSLAFFIMFGCIQQTYQRDCLGTAFSELSNVTETLQKRLDQLDHLLEERKSSSEKKPQKSVTGYNTFEFSQKITVGSKNFLLSIPKINNAYIANHMCSIYGGFLAEMENHKEYSAVMDSLRKMNKFNTCVWIGVNDEEKEGTYVYTHSKRPAYVMFAKGEPTNSLNEDCMYVHPGYTEKTMIDSPCLTNDLCQFLCQLQ